MPLVPNDLLEPAGPIAPSLFPGEDPAQLLMRLAAYIADAAARASHAGLSGATADDAARAWAEYRAFDSVVVRLAATPASVSVQDQGSRTHTSEQLRALVARRDAALSRWNALVPALDEHAPPGGLAGLRMASGSTPNVFQW